MSDRFPKWSSQNGRPCEGAKNPLILRVFSVSRGRRAATASSNLPKPPERRGFATFTGLNEKTKGTNAATCQGLPRRTPCSALCPFRPFGPFRPFRPFRRFGPFSPRLLSAPRSPPPLHLQQHPNSRRLHRPLRVRPVAKSHSSLDFGPILGEVCSKPPTLQVAPPTAGRLQSFLRVDHP